MTGFQSFARTLKSPQPSCAPPARLGCLREDLGSPLRDHHGPEIVQSDAFLPALRGQDELSVRTGVGERPFDGAMVRPPQSAEFLPLPTHHDLKRDDGVGFAGQERIKQVLALSGLTLCRAPFHERQIPAKKNSGHPPARPTGLVKW